MNHLAIHQVLERAERAKSESDFTYFFSILLAAETLTKIIILGIIAGIDDDKDRNRYRLEHQLIRSDGIGDWGSVIEDALTGPASQFLSVDAREEQTEMTRLHKEGEWQFDAVKLLKNALNHLDISAEEIPIKSDLKRWFRLFATLRNKTRGHGATLPGKSAEAAVHIFDSINLIYNNFKLFKRPWAHLHQNLNGRYRVSYISDVSLDFDFLKHKKEYHFPDGIYLFMGYPRRIALMQTDPELKDFFIANGGLNKKTFELLSYQTDEKSAGDTSDFLTPPGVLPPSETQGHGDLIPKGNCFSNVPELLQDYINRPVLEAELTSLLLDDKRPIVTLVGRGGIGKTSLAIKVIQGLYNEMRYDSIVWLSSRDVDLQFSGPKSVRPFVSSPEDMGKVYSNLVLSEDKLKIKTFNPRTFFEQQLQKCDLGPCLFVFDNFETTQNPIEMFNWIDSYIRLPNKALITTRLREFKGDYPMDIHGMNEQESRELVAFTAKSIGADKYLTDKYITELISQSEGHPYVMKILLGEIVKEGKGGNIPRLIAGTSDVLTALFERTYAVLSPCAQRAFLTLSAWNSSVPRLALEAVLYRSTGERHEVEQGIESLLQYSIAETHVSPVDKQSSIRLPLVASVFGKKKLSINPTRAAIQADAQILQLFGPSGRDDDHLGLASHLVTFVDNCSTHSKSSGITEEEMEELLRSISRSYTPGWMILGRWHMEERTSRGYDQAKDELRQFLESGPQPTAAAEAWRLLGYCCYQTNDALGEVHAFVERAQFCEIPFQDLSGTARRLNKFLREHQSEIDKSLKRDFAGRLFAVINTRKNEAQPDDLSVMAWLALNFGEGILAREYVAAGLRLDPNNFHLLKLAQKLNVA